MRRSICLYYGRPVCLWERESYLQFKISQSDSLSCYLSSLVIAGQKYIRQMVYDRYLLLEDSNQQMQCHWADREPANQPLVSVAPTDSTSPV